MYRNDLREREETVRSRRSESPASLTQAVALQLLAARGHAGFFRLAPHDGPFSALCQRHFPGLAVWTPPFAGLFFWCVDSGFKLSPRSRVRADTAGRERLGAGIRARGACIAWYRVLPNGRRTAYVRTAFSLLTPEKVEALKRLRDTALAVRAAGSTV